MSTKANRAMLEWSPISKRIQTYAPTNDATDEDKYELYNQLQDTLTDCNKYDTIVVMGDLNAKSYEGCGRI